MKSDKNIREGYKRTTVGVIPEEWEVKKIDELTKYYDGTHQTPIYEEKGIPFYSVQHVTANDFSDTKFISEEVFEKESERVVMEKGDILMTRIGDVGTAKLIDWDVKASFYVSLALIKQCDDLDSKFFEQSINGALFQRVLHKKIIHVAFPKKINLGEIGKLKLPIPPLPEQQAIANCLTTWDSGIEKLTQLIAAKREQKKGLMQQLLTGKKRLDGFVGVWSKKKLGDFLKESKIVSTNTDKSKRISVRLHLEGVEKRELRGTEADTTVFYKRKANQFIYGKQNFHNGAMGIIPKELDGFETTSDIPTFDINNKINHKWLFFFMSRYSFYKKMENRTTGTGSKRLHPKELLSTLIPYPPLKEQTAIAHILTTADQEISLLEAKLAAMKEEKKGLMQVLQIGRAHV